MAVIIAIYILAAFLLAVYGFNAWVLTFLYFVHRNKPITLGTQKETKQGLPPVTVQLPVFNEALVLERLVDAVVKLNYPAHLLQIQVLDDSTDETTDIAAKSVEQHRRRGLNIELIHRNKRPGFKAGALGQGMERATGQFIAIFDADFVPKSDYLMQVIPYLMADSQMGFVQTRWGHLNHDYSYLTEAQALAIDGHFVIEQTARNRSGLLMNFNGTAGVWRRECIQAVGGWQGDTICEDFDLSYRAQLAGWRCLFLPDVVVPAEVPPQLAAFKRQQFRWAKGSIQVLKKLGGMLLFSKLHLSVKLQGIIHLSNYLAHPLIVILAIFFPILIISGSNFHLPLVYLSLASLGPPFLFAVAQASLSPTNWKQRYRMMPLLILLGSGIALNNTKAVIEGFLGVSNTFQRTPKFNVLSPTDRWQNSNYRLPLSGLILGELTLAFYSIFGAWFAAIKGNWVAMPFILLYAFSFGFVGLQGVWDARAEVRSWFGRMFRRKSQPTNTASKPTASTYFKL